MVYCIDCNASQLKGHIRVPGSLRWVCINPNVAKISYHPIHRRVQSEVLCIDYHKSGMCKFYIKKLPKITLRNKFLNFVRNMTIWITSRTYTRKI